MENPKRRISKKIRFEVFKRDGFKCAYCGKTPPAVTLEVDHIDPKSNGGGDNMENLITACFDCNRGKSDITLDKIPSTLAENFEIMREKESQLKAYRRLSKRIERREQQDVDDIDDIYSAAYPGWKLSDIFRNGSVKIFLKKLPKHEVVGAMEKAVARGLKSDAAIKYFCGICWRKIKNGQTI